MKATETRLAALLETPAQYVVPHFQRAYSWRRAQWLTLWADILELYELGTPQPHFMGSVVLLTEGQTQLIIDGQQRLVTLSLFLAALRDRAQPTDPELAERINSGYLLNGSASEPWPRIVCSYQDQEAFTAIMLRGETIPGSPVIEAYKTFAADLADRSHEELSLSHLADVVLSQLAFVAITLDAADNPYRVFESLNAKGMPLTQGDLLRNYFFMRLPANEHDHWFRSIWQPMQSRLGDALDNFMHDYLAKDGEDVRAEEVYQAWRRRLVSLDVAGVKAVLQDLAEWSVEYDRLLHLNREPDTEARRRLQWLSAWSETLKQPLLPFLLLVQADIRHGTLRAEVAAVLLQAVQSFLARRVFTAASDAEENQQLVTLYSQTDGEADRVTAFLEALSQPAIGWPTDEELRRAMISYRLYPRSHPEQRQLLLMALEDGYPNPTRIRLGDFDIELIAPLLPRDEWLQELDGDEDVHWSVVGTIGNLTWIERGQSSRVPLRVAERLQHLRRQARRCPALARDVPLNYHWTAAAIQERSRNLAECAIVVWPGPRREGR
ncbi:MAG: DUF262 domain-containing protein [Chloroflexota bacterium]